MTVNLSTFDNRGYNPGAGILKRGLWYLVNALAFHSWLLPFYKPKVWLLRQFGARVGCDLVIKLRVNIKYPWRLDIGDNVWIGEEVWIDNLADVKIGSNVCISQGAYLLTGNHDYKDPAFSLITREISIEDGAWVAARALVCPGVCVAEGAVVAAGSVLTKGTVSNGVYAGNPATLIGQRRLRQMTLGPIQ